VIEGVAGPLLSHHYAEHELPTAFAGRLGEETRDGARRALRRWWQGDGRMLGPSSSLRVLFDLGAAPVATLLGFSARQPRPAPHGDALVADAVSRAITVPLIVASWGAPLDPLWQAAARESLRDGGAWVVCFNGRAIRLCDGRRAHARAYLDVDLERASDDPAAFAVLWGMLRAEALDAATAEIIDESANHGMEVAASLKDGVRDALLFLLQGLVASGRRGSRRQPDAARLAWTLDQAFTIVYRILFLLFAESRSLVPVWHPVYRRSYTIEALRAAAERPGVHRGLWEGFQALSRLAYAGCRAGSLTVAPFNGRLFAPARAPLADTGRLDDGLMARALTSLTTRTAGGRRERVSFVDLGVEQLGAVYESVLDYEPAFGVPAPAERVPTERVPARRATNPRSPSAAPAGERSIGLDRKGDARKSSGTFYTPRAITDYLVRHTLHPLVDGAGPDDILRLRVLDPAMGSGALLVAACRFLADAYESALVRERGCFASDISDADRAGFRRLVAQRCLYGVDLNPMAVQVARLSMWLTTLARGRPLSFLDHRLVSGDSLVGASLEDLSRQPPGGGPGTRAARPCPLFDADEPVAAIRAIVPVRNEIADTPDDTAETVRAKERMLGRLREQPTPYTALRRVADLWCACWFWSATDPARPGPGEYADLAGYIRTGRSTLPARLVQARLDEASHLADERRFLHWTLDFPEVFFDRDGAPLAAPGFDAVLANPPWEMLRGDTGTDTVRAGRRESAAQLTRFVRQSGVYRACADGHANQYQLFVERSVRLLRSGGRLGLVLPWGFASDHGSATLRSLMFDRCSTDAIIGFDNSRAVFPIHRGVRFLLLSSSPGQPTRQTRCRFGERDPAVLETVDGATRGDGEDGRTVTFTPALLRRLSGPGLAIPYVTSRADLRLVERLVSASPALSDARGWGARFGRELNRTDDRALFSGTGDGLPVVEGKHVDPFDVRIEDCRLRVRRAAALLREDLRRSVGRPRLAYRDVAASTNRLTLIAAIVPPGAVTVHTLFCLRTKLETADLVFLCCMLNSFVANYLVRMWVTTHLGTGTVERLPVPRPPDGSRAAGRLRELGVALLRARGRDTAVLAEAQALVAHLYGLSPAEYTMILESLPLVDPGLRSLASAHHRRLADPHGRV
jgi:hypothetical protein